MFDLEFYELPNGRKPVEEFVLSLSPKMQVKAYDSLKILEEKGNALREPYSKPMSNGIFELRIRFANDASRIFYFFYSGEKIVLTNGFVKKTRKTPRAHLKQAIKYKEDYERRKKDERLGKTQGKADGKPGV